MPPATQLSLFGDDDALPSPISSTTKRGRRSATPRPPRGATPLAALDLFDAPLPSAQSAPLAEPEPIPSIPIVSEVKVKWTPLPQSNKDEPDDEDEEDEKDDLSGRIPFDPTVWMLRSDRGDFIHIRTGEVRDEDEFVFGAEESGEVADGADAWDLPQ